MELKHTIKYNFDDETYNQLMIYAKDLEFDGVNELINYRIEEIISEAYRHVISRVVTDLQEKGKKKKK